MRPKIRTTQKIREIVAYYKGRNGGDPTKAATEIFKGPLNVPFDFEDRFQFEVAINILAKEAKATK